VQSLTLILSLGGAYPCRFLAAKYPTPPIPHAKPIETVAPPLRRETFSWHLRAPPAQQQPPTKHGPLRLTVWVAIRQPSTCRYVGIFGNGHTLAIELNDEQIADLIEDWIKQHVK
jgi:hypothetical protein